MIEVRRMPRNTTAGFERIPNRAIRSAELSLAAVGLLARLLADGERYDSIDEIAAAFNPAGPGEKTPYGFGRDVYRKAAIELEAAGYLVRTEEKGAGNRTNSLVRATPEKSQVAPATDSPARGRPARKPIGAGQAQDGQSVAGLTWENDAYEHVEPRTDSPSRQPPAKTTLSARQSRDGLSVADYIQTSFQTSDLLLQGDEQDGNASADEEQEEVDADTYQPHPDALAVIAAVDLGGKPLVPKSRDEAERTLTAKLAEGWTVAALAHAFVGCTEGARNPPGAFMSRVRGLGPPQRATTTRASPRCPDCNGSGLIENDLGDPAPCPACKPPRSTP